MRTLPLFAIIALTGCKTVTLTEQQFFDPRPARLADSVRAAGHWPSPYTYSQGFLQSSDGARLFRVTLTRPSSDVAILYFGGSNFQIGQDYKRFTPLLETGATVFVADYPGYGESDGKPSLDSFEKAALAAYDETLRVTGVRPRRLIVHGHSLGTMLAMYVAEQRPVGGVVLEGPPTNAREWARSFTPWFAKPFVRFRIPESLYEHDNLARIRKYQGPLLLLAGETDRETKPAMARRLYSASGTQSGLKNLVVFPGTGHMILLRDKRATEPYRKLVDLVRGVGVSTVQPR